jgi:hypothetical protein
MRAFPTVILAVALLVAPAIPAHAQAGCPAPEPQAESRVTNFLSLPQLAELRKVADLGSASASDVHALAGEPDHERCAALRRAVASSGRRSNAGDRVAFYRSGDRYFVAITPRRPADRIRIGEHSMIEVYDTEYRLVGRFSA